MDAGYKVLRSAFGALCTAMPKLHLTLPQSYAHCLQTDIVLDNGESMVDLVCHSFETADDADDAAEQYNYCAPGPCKPMSCLPARLGGRALIVRLREHALDCPGELGMRTVARLESPTST